jgi:hypothetical protein
MKAAEFAKTTLIGGLLFILPLYIGLLLLAKAALGLLALMNRSLLKFQLQSTSDERAILEKPPGYRLLRGLTGRFHRAC